MSKEEANRHSRRMNRARGGVSPDEAAAQMAELRPPAREIPLSLDPRTFDARVGLDENDQHDPVFSSARSAVTAMRRRLENFKEREAVIFADRFETPIKKRLTTSSLVSKEMSADGSRVTGAYHSIRKAIDTLDGELDRAFRARLPRQEQAELRSYMRRLTKKDRRELLINDPDIAAAALSGKLVLSGLTETEAASIRHEVLRREYPDHLARRQKLTRALSELEAAASTYQTAAFEYLDDDLGEYEETKKRVAAAVRGELDEKE